MFFFLMWGRKKKTNKKEQRNGSMSPTQLYPAVFPETIGSPRAILIGYLKVLYVLPFKLQSKERKYLPFSLKAPFSWSFLLPESFLRFCPRLFSILPEGNLMNSPFLCHLSPSVIWLTHLLPDTVLTAEDVMLNETDPFPALMELIVHRRGERW